MNDVPHSPTAELALIGCVLAHADRCYPEIATMRPDDFFTPQHRQAWDAIRALVAAGKKVDAITVGEQLRRMGPNGLMYGGPEVWCIAVMSEAPIVEQASRYADIVRENATKRRLLALCAEVSVRVKSDESPDETLSMFRRGIAELEASGSALGPVKTADSMDGVMDAIGDRDERPSHHAIMTGLDGFDRMIGGFRPGQLVIIAGPPGMGKTAWGLTVACHAAVKAQVPTLVVSLEMTTQEVIERLLAQVSGVTGVAMATGSVVRSREGMQKLYAGANTLSTAPMWIEDRPLRLGQILGEARRWYAAHVTNKGLPMGLLVVDYLGLIEADSRPGSRNAEQSRANEVAQMTRAFKLLAKDVGCPVLLLSQLNRQYTQTDRPQISQLRDSGAIEQDGNYVIFPWRDMGAVGADGSGPAEIIVGKNRGGPTGVVPCYWHAPLMRFIDAEEDGL